MERFDPGDEAIELGLARLLLARIDQTRLERRVAVAFDTGPDLELLLFIVAGRRSPSITGRLAWASTDRAGRVLAERLRDAGPDGLDQLLDFFAVAAVSKCAVITAAL